MIRASIWLGLALAMMAPLRATDYYVNGLTGSDVPTAGTTAAAPWKTIAYALSQIPVPASGTHTLFVAGNQVYSVGTNGESFPLSPIFNVAVQGMEATPSNYPIIQIPASTDGLVFDPTVIFNRNQVTFRRLAFDGGDHAAVIGGNAMIRHRPRFWQCEFRNQAVAGAFLDMNGGTIQDPRFVQCLFENMPTGLRCEASGSGSVLTPDIEECTFQNISLDGISIRDTSGVKSNVGGIIRTSTFDNCCRGVSIYSAINAQFTATTIERCTFRGGCDIGVSVLIDRPGDPQVTVRSCSFFGGNAGVLLDGILAPGPYSLTLEDNYVEGAAIGFGAGIVRGQGDLTLDWTRNTARNCTAGFYIDVQDNGVLVTAASQGDRAFDCGIGFYTRGPSTNGSIDVQNGIFSSCTGHGMSLTSALPTLARSLTLADNGTGLEFTNASHTIDHLILSANGTNVVGVAGQNIDHSCIDGSTWPGTGNLNAVPDLIRPHYVLDDTSPCIDAGDTATTFAATDFEGSPRQSVSVMGGAARADIGADEFVYDGSHHTFGVGGWGLAATCPHIGSPNTTVVTGSPLTIDCTDAIDIFGTPSVMAVPLLGMSEVGPLSDLTGVGMPNNMLIQDVFGVGPFQMVDPAGNASFTVTVPVKSYFPGETFIFQWAVFDPDANQAGVVMSDALRVTVGR